MSVPTDITDTGSRSTDAPAAAPELRAVDLDGVGETRLRLARAARAAAEVIPTDHWQVRDALRFAVAEALDVLERGSAREPSPWLPPAAPVVCVVCAVGAAVLADLAREPGLVDVDALTDPHALRVVAARLHRHVGNPLRARVMRDLVEQWATEGRVPAGRYVTHGVLTIRHAADGGCRVEATGVREGISLPGLDALGPMLLQPLDHCTRSTPPTEG